MAKYTVNIDEQDDLAVIKIGDFKVVEITNRTEELFVEIRVFDTDTREVLLQSIGTDILKTFED